MDISTSRFGTVHCAPSDLLVFPRGVIGWESCHQWVLLSEADNQRIGWLQSVDQPELAFAAISPRELAADYRVRISKRELVPLELGDRDRVLVLVVISRHGGRLTVNLKAPVVINLTRLLGRQVTVSDDQPLRLELSAPPVVSREVA